jgi:hypothetical protein
MTCMKFFIGLLGDPKNSLVDYKAVVNLVTVGSGVNCV